MISNNKMIVPGLLAIMIQINIITTPNRLWVGAIVRVQSHLAPKRAQYIEELHTRINQPHAQKTEI
jgi:hypothetical protein